MTTQREEMRKLRAVSDASILIHLSAIGRFHLLMDLFQEIVIPEGVYEEVVVEGWGLPGSLETAEAIRSGFIAVKRVIDKEEVRNISYEYGISVSNAEVIQLAKKMNAEVVLADEEEVREGAEERGFDVRGSPAALSFDDIITVDTNINRDIGCSQVQRSTILYEEG